MLSARLVPIHVCSGGGCERGEEQFADGLGEFIESRVAGLWQNCLGPQPPADRTQGVGERHGCFAGPHDTAGPLRFRQGVNGTATAGSKPHRHGPARRTIFEHHPRVVFNPGPRAS